MTKDVEFAWFAPTNGDGFYQGLREPERESTFPYVRSVAIAAEAAGFDAILIPTNSATLDPWLTAAVIAEATKRLQPIVAVRPGFISPTVVSKMASSLDLLSNGRVALNMVTGGYPAELAADGDFTEHDERYARTEEFVQIFRLLWSGSTIDYTGRFFRLKGSALIPRPRRELPRMFVAGVSPHGYRLAGLYHDVYLMWAESIDGIRLHQEMVMRAARAADRNIRFGLRVGLVMRDTDEEAWTAAQEMVSRATPEVQARVQKYYENVDSHGQKRIHALTSRHKLGPAEDVIEENLWTGMARIKPGNATALVGSPESIEKKIVKYIRDGISFFIFSGFPHLEEASRIGDQLLPRLREATSGDRSAEGRASLLGWSPSLSRGD